MDRKEYKVPEQSYSRQLDNRVAAEEMPYGYESSPPPYDHENGPVAEQYKKGSK